MTTEYWKQLEGETPSSMVHDCYFYSTNYGGLEINRFSKEVTYACIGFTANSNEPGDKRITIKIIGDEISIQTGTLYKANTELCTPNYPYKLLHYPRPDLVKVFDILYNFAPMSKSIISVVLKVIKTFENKFNNTEKKHAVELLNLIKFQHSSSILRTPIVKRVPIKDITIRGE